MLLYEVAATISVLLGFAPPSSLPADSSYKVHSEANLFILNFVTVKLWHFGPLHSQLNEVLAPNPFDRPHAVMILEVSGVEGQSFQLNQRPKWVVIYLFVVYMTYVVLAGQLLSADYLKAQLGSVFKRRVIGSSKAEIQLPG